MITPEQPPTLSDEANTLREYADLLREQGVLPELGHNLRSIAANLDRLSAPLSGQTDKEKGSLTAPEARQTQGDSGPSAADVAVARKKYLQLGSEIQAGKEQRDLEHTHSKLGIFLGEAFGEKVWRGEA